MFNSDICMESNVVMSLFNFERLESFSLHCSDIEELWLTSSWATKVRELPVLPRQLNALYVHFYAFVLWTAQNCESRAVSALEKSAPSTLRGSVCCPAW
jgi:hypothetical protein